MLTGRSNKLLLGFIKSLEFVFFYVFQNSTKILRDQVYRNLDHDEVFCFKTALWGFLLPNDKFSTSHPASYQTVQFSLACCDINFGMNRECDKVPVWWGRECLA